MQELKIKKYKSTETRKGKKRVAPNEKNIKVEPEAHRRLSIYCAQTGEKIKDIATAALNDWLDRQEGLKAFKKKPGIQDDQSSE